jgi:SAM-dependent methyltransferase
MSRFKSEALTFIQDRENFESSFIQKKYSIFQNFYHAYLLSVYKTLVLPNSSILELGCGSGKLLLGLNPSRGVGVDFSSKYQNQLNDDCGENFTFICSDVHKVRFGDEKFDYIILSDLVNDLWDIQEVLLVIRNASHSRTKIILNFRSHLWSYPLLLANKLGWARPTLRQNWVTRTDIVNLLEISNFQSLRVWTDFLFPIPLGGVSRFFNRYIAKLWPFNLFNLINFVIDRPLPAEGIKIHVSSDLSVSIIVAARNESGHISELLERIPEMGSGTEVIFVEGGSSDDTYLKIESEISKRPGKFKLLKQSGKGKGDAVRLGFDNASGDILMILDADITVPPEDLIRFYILLNNGSAEFVNGVRLVYPMEDDAMRFMNLVGNKFFSSAFTWLLGQPIRDTLCGTKALKRADYEKIAMNRSYFGEFDPFGDFDLLFGAARMNLKIQEVPIRYRARRYGETNISRWSHGWLLLKMVLHAAKRIKFTP